MSRRFGLLIDPLDMTGLCGSLCEPYWLVTVSGFQGSSCSGFPAYPAVLPAACRLSCVRRQGDTIRTRPEAVNGLSEVFSSTSRGDFRRRIPETKNASRIHRKASERRSTAYLRLLCSLWFRLPIPPTGFQHTLQCLSRLSAARCRTVSATAQRRKGLITSSLYLPTNRSRLTRSGPPVSALREALGGRSETTMCARQDARIGACRPAEPVHLNAPARSYIGRTQAHRHQP